MPFHMTVCKRLHVKSFNKSTLAKLSMEMEQTSVASVAIHHLAFSLAAKGIILNPTSMQQKKPDSATCSICGFDFES